MNPFPRILRLAYGFFVQNKILYGFAKAAYDRLPVRIKAKIRENIFAVSSKGRGELLINDIKLAEGTDVKGDEVYEPRRIKGLGSLETWQIEGGFNGSYSLNIVNRELAKALDAIGIDVSLYSEKRLGDNGPDLSLINQDKKLKELYNKGLHRKKQIKDVIGRQGYPPYIGEMDSHVKILHCYAWEESKYPSSWIDAFNTELHAVSVVSRHVKNILINNGLIVPCFVSGLGVDHLKAINEKEVEGLAKFERKFKFLHISSCFPRKGIDELLDSYFQEFTKNDEVVLIIKTFPNVHNNLFELISEKREKYHNDPEIYVINEELDSAEIKYLYKYCDVLVSPSRAEGFNMPALEAMACGKAIIVTNWSGHTMFCRSSSNQLVEYNFEFASSHLKLQGSYWARPDISSLRKALRYAKENKNKQDAAILYSVKNKYTWEHVARNVFDNVNLLLGFDLEKPKIGWISTWNKRCGIASYSQKLLKYCPFQHVILAPIDDSSVEKDGPAVARCWHQRTDEHFDSAINIIKSQGINVVVIQWHPGIFYKLDLANLVNNLRSLGVISIICLHSTSDQLAMTELKGVLRFFDRVLVHSLHDLNRLHSLGVVDNVCLWPHGIDVEDFKTTKKRDEKAEKNLITIGTFGFCLPHKGLKELIYAMSIVKDRNPDIRVRGIFMTSLYQSAESKFLADEIRKLIKEKKLEVEFNTDYLDEKEIASKLQSVDMVVYAYQKTGESSSAAVRCAIGLEKPTLVTPLDIFDDVKYCVQFTDNTTPQSIADGIEDVYKNIVMNKDNLELTKKTQIEWLRDHSCASVAKRLFHMSYALYQDEFLKKYGMVDFDDDQKRM